jgi:hypothetical protein
MASAYQRGFSRITAARQHLVDVRAARMEQLLRLRTYLRGELADFTQTVDPITGVRLAEILAEGSKTNGDLSLAVTFFEGSNVRFAVDRRGRFVCTATPADVLDGIARILDIRVRGDVARAEFDYEPEGESGTRRTANFDSIVERLVERAALAAEADLDRVPERHVAFSAQLAEAARARGGLGFSVG